MRKVLLIGIPLILVVLAAVFFIVNPFKIDFFGNNPAVSTDTSEDQRDFSYTESSDVKPIDRNISTISLYDNYTLVAADNNYILSKMTEFGVWNKGGVTIFDFFGKNLGNGSADVMEVAFVLSNDTTAPYPFEVSGGKYRVSLQNSGQFLYIEMYVNESELSTLSESDISKKLSDIAYTSIYRLTHPETMTTGAQQVVAPDRSFLSFTKL